MQDFQELKTKIAENAINVINDSRLIKPGEYYVAVKGETFDGHKFIDDALEKGAAGYIEKDGVYELARYKLEIVKPKIVGITGSSGKTTTTNFIYTLIKDKFIASKGKLNTKLGLSMNVINNMPLDCEVFVAEMGMDYMGELKNTTSLFTPDISVITTINETHAEKLGNIENILKAKWEIVEGTKGEGIAIINYENELLNKRGMSIEKSNYKVSRSHPKIKWFGFSREAHYNPAVFELSKFIIPGEHNKLNVLAAIGVATELGMKKEIIEKNLDNLSLAKGRLSIIPGKNGAVLIDDTYNASPASTTEALKVLCSRNEKIKVAILGDMLELGVYEKSGHQKIGNLIDNMDIDILIAVGKRGKIIFDAVENKKKYWIEKSTNFKDILNKKFTPQENQVILIKGSQGARMEKITEMLMLEPEKASELLVRQDERWK